MPSQSDTYTTPATFNKYGLHLRWPRIWIIIVGIILIFLCVCIAGMEIGHTIYDLYRSTAFGGFILFIPLLICSIFVLITACKPRLILLRIATILCCIMIILCILLIVYDILVLIDPTRCFFLNCDNAQVTYQVNSTYNTTITGWPLNISWPNYFQTNMNGKRILQSIQIFCAALFILFCSLYILTYIIYRRIYLDQGTIDKSDQHTFVRHKTVTSPITRSNSIVQSFPQYNLNRLVTVYTIEGRPSTSVIYSNSPAPPIVHTITPRKANRKTVVRQRAKSANYDRICTRCMIEPRIILTTNYQRQNFFSHLCINCNKELVDYHQKPHLVQSENDRTWKP
ncbi:unnamed protein product [Rotaria sordida]|uniref:Uncharacterized protein n=1 Tax=Rotaria sordida TaxID=392033 RepID=A0A813WMM4_9BILA|nr:unnamed protein product [Rotaria sordida]